MFEINITWPSLLVCFTWLRNGCFWFAFQTSQSIVEESPQENCNQETQLQFSEPCCSFTSLIHTAGVSTLVLNKHTSVFFFMKLLLIFVICLVTFQWFHVFLRVDSNNDLLFFLLSRRALQLQPWLMKVQISPLPSMQVSQWRRRL